MTARVRLGVRQRFLRLTWRTVVDPSLCGHPEPTVPAVSATRSGILQLCDFDVAVYGSPLPQSSVSQGSLGMTTGPMSGGSMMGHQSPQSSLPPSTVTVCPVT